MVFFTRSPELRALRGQRSSEQAVARQGPVLGAAGQGAVCRVGVPCSCSCTTPPEQVGNEGCSH